VLYDALKEPFAVEAVREERLLAAAQIASRVPDPAVCVEAFTPLEPPPWTPELLELRLRCYTRANHPLMGAATKDLLEMREGDAQLGSSIPTPPPPVAAPPAPAAPPREATDGPADAAPP
jgi:hypothetical protein